MNVCVCMCVCVYVCVCEIQLLDSFHKQIMFSDKIFRLKDEIILEKYFNIFKKSNSL